MTLWNIIPGRWSIKQGIDSNDDQLIDSDLSESSVELENGKSVDLVKRVSKFVKSLADAVKTIWIRELREFPPMKNNSR